MNTPMPVPCPQWENQLAALHPDDLSSTERKALAAHTAVCPACAAVLADYRRLQELARQVLIFPPPLPLWDNHAQNPFQNPLALPGRSPGAGDQAASSGSPSRNVHTLSDLGDPSRRYKQLTPPVGASLITASGRSSLVEVLPAGVSVRDPAGSRYVIETLLGEGGSGAVYLVRDQNDDQQRFALKEMINPDKHDRERFTFEGQVLWRLEHRALPRVYRVFENDKLKRVYMLMDYIEGPNLEVLQKEQMEQRFPLGLSLALLAPIIDALNYLHHQDPPIVHRDVKPANIIVPMKGEGAVLVDFGIAKEFVEDRTTNVIRHGSPGYAAPEQYGGGTNPQTDLYGLAATVYTMLTGVIPPDAITRATRSKSLDPLRQVNLLVPAIAPEVARAIERAMSISLDDRFETIDQFWQELHGTPTREWITVAPTMQSPAPGPRSLPEQSREKTMMPPLQQERPEREARRRGILLPVLLALLLCLVAGGVSLLAFASRATSSPPASHTVTPARTPSIPASTVTVSPFPQLATSYAGTIFDLLSKQTTPMYLTNVKQSGGNIQGTFSGLGQVGPFKGTVSTGGKVQFTVSVYGGTETLSFEGTIKIGGDIVGTMDALDLNGNKMGESGIWNAGPNL
jgi:serine/threonine protein kinase